VGGYSQKVGWGCTAHFPKPMPQLWPKCAVFATLFMTWPKIWHPIYDRCGWQSCPKRKLWRAFVDGLIDNDEKVASSKKHTQLKTKSAKTIPNLRPKWPKSIPYLWPKRLENPTLWDRTYLYSPYKGVPPPPGLVCTRQIRARWPISPALISPVL